MDQVNEIMYRLTSGVSGPSWFDLPWISHHLFRLSCPCPCPCPYRHLSFLAIRQKHLAESSSSVVNQHPITPLFWNGKQEMNSKPPTTDHLPWLYLSWHLESPFRFYW
jgi:hypothetical protein